MNVQEYRHTNGSLSTSDLLISAVEEQRPLVLVLGQDAWSESENENTVLAKALDRLGRHDGLQRGWSALLGTEPVPDEFYDWLAERLTRRVHSQAHEAVAGLPWSAVFTSSFDPTLRDLLQGPAREPVVILTEQETPPAARSRARPPLYFLFSRAGEHDSHARPPRSRSDFNARRLRHAVPLLNRVVDTATALGIIVVEGFSSGNDWFRLDDLLGIIGNAAPRQVLWFGGRPRFRDDVEAEFDDAVASQRILLEPRRLGTIVAELRALERLPASASPDSEDPGTVTLSNGGRMETTAELRLRVEAVASIIDDSWTAFLPPLGKDAEYARFRRFHGNLEGFRLMVEGVRRGYAIQRDFEVELRKQVSAAIADPSSNNLPIVVEGQSGSGKSVALARAAVQARDREKVPVLYSFGRIPTSQDVFEFCESAEKAGASATLIICDANRDIDQYYPLLMGLKSRGRRVVVLGSQYRSDLSPADPNTGIEAPGRLSSAEASELEELISRHVDISDRSVADPDHILAFLYRCLPASRPRIGAGLSEEARAVERALRARGRQVRRVTPITLLHQRLIEAGFVSEESSFFDEQERNGEEDGGDAAALVIDFVMIAGSVNCLIPVNLLMRSVTAQSQEIDLTIITQLFHNIDLFRWKSTDSEGSDILVGPRLTIEAEVLCRHRFGGVASEAECLLEIMRAVRDGGLDNERTEVRFLLDLLQQVGPEGMRGQRYKHAYVAVGRTLTELRERYGVIDARLILQESAFRRGAIRHQVADDVDRLPLLEEARDAIQYALEGIANGSLYVGRRTKDSLLVERAAIYGFLARNLADSKGDPEVIWKSYGAARDAIAMAVGASDNYYPYDVGLWTPSDLLECGNLKDGQRAELTADIYSTLDQVEVSNLSPAQQERYLTRRMKVGSVLQDQRLTDDAYDELEDSGSTAGYYLRAREHIVNIDRDRDIVDDQRLIDAAGRAADFLGDRFDRIATDQRCLLLLLECRWIVEMGTFPLKGERQPLPVDTGVSRRLLEIVRTLNQAAGGAARHVPRYLEAVLAWITDDEEYAIPIFRDLARDTDHEFPGRVVRRHVITDAVGNPSRFAGRVERDRGDGHWGIRVEGLDRRVDLLSRDFPREDIAYGRMVSGFGIAFNFIGPIADPIR